MKINIAGDFYISKEVNNPLGLVDNVVSLFQNVDLNIVNLESPITHFEKDNRIVKVGPHLNGNELSFRVLSKLNVKLVTLANNHILDFGESGVNETILKLNENSISNVGAGENIFDAIIPFSIQSADLKIAVINFTENEWSIANESGAGANPMDIIENVKQIRLAKLNHDKVICIIHGGHEYYHLPSPRMVRQYRFYADNGVDAIICHHSHSISGYEIYNNVPIFYGLGNFLFTLNSKQECWRKGLVLQLEINKRDNVNFKLFPIKQKLHTFELDLLEGTEKEILLSEIESYSNIIKDPLLLKHNWQDFLKRKSKQYIESLSPINLIRNRILRAALRRLNLNNFFLKKSNLKEILNVIQCESHIEALKEIVKRELK